jgi:hypothetical protein
MGSVAGHPILRHTIDWLRDHWQKVELQFPGKGNQQVFYRKQHRVVRALNEGVGAELMGKEFNSIVLPSYYVSEASAERAVYAAHAHAMSWKKAETDRTLVERFDQIRAKLSSAFVWACGLGLLNVICGLWVVKLMWAIRKRVA